MTSEPSEVQQKTLSLSFEDAIEELSGIVSAMEGESLPLEQTITTFERGVLLTTHCQKLLKDAELKVQALTEENGSLTFTPFEQNPQNSEDKNDFEP